MFHALRMHACHMCMSHGCHMHVRGISMPHEQQGQTDHTETTCEQFEPVHWLGSPTIRYTYTLDSLPVEPPNKPESVYG